MEVCEKYRVPHSVFLRWDSDDRDKAIAFHVRQRSRCPSCGTRPEEWDPKQGGDPAAYTASLKRCRGCQAVQLEQESLESESVGGGRHGVYVTLKRS